jgi:hypothetical protein
VRSALSVLTAIKAGLWVRALRQLGELLGPVVTTGYKSLPDGITRMQSSRWQALAKLPGRAVPAQGEAVATPRPTRPG